ncbi:CBO0543 family protein [Alicyclobacillus sp. ALC3]|uniref:CBO0543 family protein n=1 Tax=Alicyclobacillus sp. ALC3 TaxID=2796143 RepID=UPI0023781FA7|nr:CBO0543 family protein [Alicyclobacillus sp. ALC3]WDL96806.1 hypothetical protein JC200_21350 [Alicyclobacillus sp. ALC3]
MKMLSIDDLIYDQKRSTSLRIQHWLHIELFSWQWWLMVIVWFGSVLLWWRLADKKRIKELLLYGFMSACVITLLDDIGSELGAWGYGYNVIPVFNRLMPVDFGVLSVAYMLTYQVFKPWKLFIAGHILLAFVLAFVAEPFAKHSGVYIQHGWSNVYSFPIYIAMPIVLRLIMEQLFRVENR